MEWNEKLQIIIDYVENHLQQKEEPIDHDEISRIAGCSFSFFQKVFSFMNGFSFSEYVRYRKLTLAGYDIKSTQEKIVAISYKYGYDSPTSFTKAFQQFHGITPSEARNKETELKIVAIMQIASKQKFTYRIVEKASFRLIGKHKTCSCKNGKHYEEIPAFWSECQKNGVYASLISLDKSTTRGMFGLFGNHDSKKDELEYSIMVSSDEELMDGYHEIILPKATWFIFDCIGSVPQAIHSGWKYLYEEWLVNYPFKHAACPDLEWYSDENPFSNEYLSQIWIPIEEEIQ